MNSFILYLNRKVYDLVGGLRRSSSCKVTSISISVKPQKQPLRGVLSKKCSENIRQIYRRTPMPKCDFNEVALELY